MRYKKIFGFFNYSEFYSEMIERFPNGSTFIELGVYFGKSLSFLAESIQKRNKNIHVYGIDKWYPGAIFDGNHRKIPKEIKDTVKTWDDVYNIALKNLEKFENVTLIRSDSAKAANLFSDSSVEFVFVDAGHEFKMVKNDILSWYPKIKPGGIIAGHDYSDEFLGVKCAVDIYLKERKIFNRGSVWYVERITR